MRSLLQNSKKALILSFTILFIVGLFGLLIWYKNDYTIQGIESLAATNRSVNAYFMAIITSMALIITLTSNLYSPRLVKVFVVHPLTICGVGYILITNLIITICHILAPNHELYNIILFLAYTLTILAMLGMIPFLYLISKFVRPQYFIPLMGHYAINELKVIHQHDLAEYKRKKECEYFFENIDVINNMASTAIQRKDRVVLNLVLTELFQILKTLISFQENEKYCQKWRKKYYHFNPGLSEEGKYYLKKHKTWPEAYILSKVLESTNVLAKSDNEVVPLVCRELTKTNDIANTLNNNHLVELHLMILNSILKGSLEDYNQSKFSITTYYYRLNIELIIGNEEICQMALKHFLYYGELALNMNELEASKSYLFDLGRVINYLAFESEDLAIKFYDEKLKHNWNLFIEEDERYKKLVMQSIVKTFWILYSQNHFLLTRKIQRDYLASNKEHAKILEDLLAFSNPLNRDYNDTFVCTEYMSGMARRLASDFLKELSS
jgi:hypothetical protein